MNPGSISSECCSLVYRFHANRDQKLINSVLEAGTRIFATTCSRGLELRRIKRGKLADLIVVEHNPLEILNTMDSFIYVVKEGEHVLSPY